MAISSIYSAVRKSSQNGVEQLYQDTNCNYCTDIYDPGESKTGPVSIKGSRHQLESTYTVKNCGSFQFNGCQDQTVTNDGVLTDCLSRSRNASAQSFIGGGSQLNGWGVGPPARGDQKRDDESRFRRHSHDGATPYYRQRNLDDGWVLLDVKMVKEIDERLSSRQRAFSR